MSNNVYVLLGSFLTSLTIVIFCGCLFLSYSKFVKNSEAKLEKAGSKRNRSNKDEFMLISEISTSKKMTECEHNRHVDKVESNKKILHFQNIFFNLDLF